MAQRKIERHNAPVVIAHK